MKKWFVVPLELTIVVSLFSLMLLNMPNTFFELSNNSTCEIKYQKWPESAQKQSEKNRSINTKIYILDLENCSYNEDQYLLVRVVQYKEIHLEAFLLNREGESFPNLSSTLKSRFPVYSIETTVPKLKVTLSSNIKLRPKFYFVDKSDYLSSNRAAHIFYTSVFTSFATIFLINFLIYARSRDKDYAAYLPFLFFVILFLFFSEGVFRYVNNSLLEILVNKTAWLVSACSVFFANRFIIRFTRLDVYFPKVTFFSLTIPSYFCLLFGALSCFYPLHFQTTIQILSLWLAIATFSALTPLLTRNEFSIEYVFVAWSILLVAIVARVGYGLGFVDINSVVIHGVLVASLFEALLLSLALGYKLEKLKTTQFKLTERAITDELTGIYNLRGLKEKSASVFASSQSLGVETQLSMLDIDFFKRVNDSYGHHAGDMILKTLVKRLKNMLRENDIFGRYGGEEFVILFPNTTKGEAIKILSRISETISKQKFQFNEKQIMITISMGITTVNSTDSCLEDSLVRADKALYNAKNNGRDRIESCFE
jgi:diguanylate cyclase (GGDEF)-like protein